MNRPTKILALAFCAVATAFLLTACGGGDAEPPPQTATGGGTSTAGGPDTTPPTLAIFNDVSGTKATGPVTFTFVFSKDVGTSFDISDVVVTGGTPGTLTKFSAKQYTLIVTPATGTAGTISVAVRAGAFSDLVGNISTAAAAAVPVLFDAVVKTQMALPVTFDSTTVDYGFIGFGGAEDSSVIVDPTNASNLVAKVVRAAGSETYAGTTITAAAGLGFSAKIPFNANDTRMSVRVWSPDANIPVRLKVEDHTDPTKSVETEATVTTAAGWQTLTFNFAAGSQASGTGAINFASNYDKVTIFFDFGRAKASSVQKTYYFDDVAFMPGSGTSGGGGGAATAPTVAATTPPVRASTDVRSIYSDAYAPIAGLDLNPNWGQTTVASTVQIAGNATRKYATLNYQGIDFSGNPIDLSTFSKLHIDLWTADVASVKVSIISNGLENSVTLTPTLSSWNGVDIDLAQYTVPNKSAILQIKIEGTPTGGTLYFDNLYFWKTAAGGGGSGSALVTFDEATAPKLTDFGTNGAGASIVTDPAGGTNKVLKVNKYLAPTQSEQWAGTTVSTGVNDSIAAIPFTASAKTLSMRVYSPAAGVRVRVKVEDASNGGVSVETDAITTKSGAWEVLTFNFANPGLSPPVGGGATSALDLTKTYNKLSIFMDFGIGNGGSANLPANRVYYVDDITFGSGASAGGGGGSSAPVIFSSGFGATTTVEGGAFGGYSGSSFDGFNCGAPASCGSGGSFTPTVTAANSGFYYYYQTPGPATSLYAGIYVQAPGLTTGLSGTGDTAGVSASGKTVMKFQFNQNPEWFNSPTPNFGVILTLGKFYDVDPSSVVQPCNIKLLAVVTPSAVAPTNYSIPISSFGIIQACNVSGLTPASALALSSVSQVDFQAVGSGNPLPPVGGKLVGANMSVGAGSPAVYPTTLVVNGAITFE